MTDEQRKLSTNGIWLCRKCAKLIDSDQRRYTTELLYRWRQDQENNILLEMEGKQTDYMIRENIVKLFKNESRKSLQIIIDKPEFWEYILTAQILEDKLTTVNRDYNDLQRGVRYSKSLILSEEEFLSWIKAKLDDLSNLVGLLTIIINDDLMKSFGHSGKSGNEDKILYSCAKIYEASIGMLEWEESVTFTQFPESLNSIKDLMAGWSRNYIFEINKISKEIRKIFENEDPSGIFKIKLVFNAPDNLEEVQKEITAYYDA